MILRRISALLLAIALFAAGCGSATTTATDGGAGGQQAALGQPCDPGPSPDAGVDETIDPDRRGEALVLHLTGIDELAVNEENEGEDIRYDDPNYGGVYGDSAGGWVVAVVDCSQVDPDRIAQIAGGPDAVRLIEVAYSFEQMNRFEDVLRGQLADAGIQLDVNIDSTLDGRTITLMVGDPGLLPENFGDGVPDDAYTIDTDGPSLLARGTEMNVELELDSECRRGYAEAGGASWAIIDAAPFEWVGRSSILGDLEMNGTTATFTSYGDDDTPESLSVELTTGAINADCPTWEPPQPAEPWTTIGPLDCGERLVVEDRLANTGQDPTELAMSYNADVVRVEPGDPLFWEAFDANGQVVVLMATGDDDLQDWQVWTCGFDAESDSVSIAAEADATQATTSVPAESTRPVSFTEYEQVGDGSSLTLVLDACFPDINNVDVEETGEVVTIAVVESFTPPTTNALGEADSSPDCQSATGIELAQPLADRKVVDAATGDMAEDVTE